MVSRILRSGKPVPCEASYLAPRIQVRELKTLKILRSELSMCSGRRLPDLGLSLLSFTFGALYKLQDADSRVLP